MLITPFVQHKLQHLMADVVWTIDLYIGLSLSILPIGMHFFPINPWDTCPNHFR